MLTGVILTSLDLAQPLAGPAKGLNGIGPASAVLLRPIAGVRTLGFHQLSMESRCLRKIDHSTMSTTGHPILAEEHKNTLTTPTDPSPWSWSVVLE